MNNQIEIYQTSDKQTTISVQFENDTVWLTQQQMAILFQQTKQNISLHIANCYKEGELENTSTVKEYLTVQREGNRNVRRKIVYYNLDVIISVGYRVKSKQGTMFRQWATKRLKEFLVQGFTLNEKRLAESSIQIQTIKTGISILNRVLQSNKNSRENTILSFFSKGLELLDDYDNERLDTKGLTKIKAVYPSLDEYLEIMYSMKNEYSSKLFGKQKDHGFESSIYQIEQSFNGQELYETIEEKAATLLYLIVKNHSFVDGNKRIAAACFLKFLEANNLLNLESGETLISNEALASLTLFIASSKSDEMDSVKKLLISVLNRGQKR